MTHAVLVALGAAVGGLVVGPFVVHAVVRWTGWRVAVPLLLGARARRGRGREPTGTVPALRCDPGPRRPAGDRRPGRGRAVPALRGAAGARLPRRGGGLRPRVGGRHGRSGVVGRAGAGARPGDGPDRHVGGRPRRHAHPHPLRLRHRGGRAGAAPRWWRCSTDRPAGWRAQGSARWRWVGSCWSSTSCRPGRSGSATCGSGALVGAAAGWSAWRPDHPVLMPVQGVLNAGLVAGLVGSVVGLALLVVRRRDRPFPFGPALAVGGLVVTLATAGAPL